MIDALSRKITGLIKENVEGITPEKEEIIEYGIKLAIYEVLVLISTFLVAMFLGVFKYFLVAFIVYGVLRLFEGGAHAGSRIKCFSTYFVTMFGIIFISKYIWIDSLYYSIPVFVLNIYIAYVYAPGDTIEKPILRTKVRLRLKFGSLILSVLIYVLACIMWRFDKVVFYVILLSTIPVTFLLSPIGYKLSGCKRSS